MAMRAAFMGRNPVRLVRLAAAVTPATTPVDAPLSTNPLPDAGGVNAAQQPIELTQEQLQQLLSQQGAAGSQVPTSDPSGGSAARPPGAQDVQTLIRHGAIVEVEISAPPAQVSAGGQALPTQKVRLMVDTGASITGVRDSVAAAAGLIATDSVQVGGVAGTQTSAIYGAKISLPKYNINFDAVQIAGFQLPGQHDIDGLMGRDLLQKMQLTYVGYAGAFDLKSIPGEVSSTADILSLVAMGGVALAAFGSLFWFGKTSR
jgi:hypothetical protein